MDILLDTAFVVAAAEEDEEEEEEITGGSAAMVPGGRDSSSSINISAGRGGVTGEGIISTAAAAEFTGPPRDTSWTKRLAEITLNLGCCPRCHVRYCCAKWNPTP